MRPTNRKSECTPSRGSVGGIAGLSGMVVTGIDGETRDPLRTHQWSRQGHHPECWGHWLVRVFITNYSRSAARVRGGAG